MDGNCLVYCGYFVTSIFQSHDETLQFSQLKYDRNVTELTVVVLFSNHSSPFSKHSVD